VKNDVVVDIPSQSHSVPPVETYPEILAVHYETGKIFGLHEYYTPSLHETCDQVALAQS
jgi:hypothetical protein